MNNSSWDSGSPRRILGMKPWQIILLGGMAGMDCLVFAVGAYMLFGSMQSRSPNQSSAAELGLALTRTAASLATAVPSPLPSETPTPLDFLLPTFTPNGTLPASPTPTPSPTSEMEGWVKFSVREVEIWMPGSYAAGNPHTDTKAITASLKGKGANYNFANIEKQMTSIEKNYIFWGIDSFQSNPSIITNVAIRYNYPTPGETMEDYATQFIGANSADFQLIEQQKVPSTLYEIERVILGTKNTQETSARLVFYAVRDQNVIWDILCITAADEMTARLRTFDLMAATFRVLAAPQ
jgi:hypothetical protein